MRKASIFCYTGSRRMGGQNYLSLTVSVQEETVMPEKRVLLLLVATIVAATTGCSVLATRTAASDPEARKAEEDRKKSYGGGLFATKPAFEDDFLPGWEKNQKDWHVATWMQNGTQMSPERCATDGNGFLVQTVLAGDPPRGGSLQTRKEYGYGRWVGRLKPSAVAGALNSFFSDDWDNLATPETPNDGTKFEIDIEFVTASFGPGKGQVELALHSAFGKRTPYGKIVDLDFNPSDSFHIWGFDILPDRIVWHCDGKVIGEYVCGPGESVPDIGHELFMNSWTARKWVKGPPASDAKYFIDWVRFYPLVRKQ